ncbi:polysaccharide pyruvyl transferase family protein [Brenneria tiliae]|uniref:Polysaccharide pyruvyl transferase family protein n=1 Tax=Brenneria tiliae TaxID=2914984 RepID=A0ABT0MXS2_9GAMM|nr:polysaccharide pyruvyl transferase family protein [Brenneria tiliae]MCL2894645.1 polysaccharide pyruvyl transferase family protein [Brenneria tiliae]
MEKKKVKVCLTWHNFDSANYGVVALTISHISMLYSAAKSSGVEISIDTLGTAAKESLNIRSDIAQHYNTDINHIPYSVRGILKLNFLPLTFHKNYDLIIDIGEGDSFTDIYGVKRFTLLTLTKVLPIFSGTPVILAPQTIGPFNRSWVRKIAAYAMKRAKYVFVRDRKSEQCANDLNVQVRVVPDVAFSLPFDTDGQVLRDSVGINVSGLLWHDASNEDKKFGLSCDYKKLIVALIEGFRARKKVIHLVSHVFSDEINEDDVAASRDIKRLFKDDDGVIVAPHFKTPVEAKSYISRLEFFIGSRMHATIAAISAGVPTIPIAYSRKFEGVFELIEYNYTLNAYDLSELEIADNVFLNFDSNIDEIRNKTNIAKMKGLAGNQVYIDYLTAFFEEMKK